MPKIAPITKSDIIIRQLKNLKSDYAFSLLMGDYKGFKNAYKQYAKLAVDNFEIASHLESPVKGKIPLFSKPGLKIIKCMLFNAFRIKTPEEKLLKKMGRDFKNKRAAESFMKN